MDQIHLALAGNISDLPWTGKWTFASHTKWRISGLAKEFLPLEAGLLRWMELVIGVIILRPQPRFYSIMRASFLFGRLVLHKNTVANPIRRFFPYGQTAATSTQDYSHVSVRIRSILHFRYFLVFFFALLNLLTSTEACVIWVGKMSHWTRWTHTLSKLGSYGFDEVRCLATCL
jgi:hypothetical protein